MDDPTLWVLKWDIPMYLLAHFMCWFSRPSVKGLGPRLEVLGLGFWVEVFRV